jgi:hypothetical protein
VPQQTNVSQKQALDFIEKAKKLISEKPDVKAEDKSLLTRN